MDNIKTGLKKHTTRGVEWVQATGLSSVAGSSDHSNVAANIPQ